MSTVSRITTTRSLTAALPACGSGRRSSSSLMQECAGISCERCRIATAPSNHEQLPSSRDVRIQGPIVTTLPWTFMLSLARPPCLYAAHHFTVTLFHPHPFSSSEFTRRLSCSCLASAFSLACVLSRLPVRPPSRCIFLVISGPSAVHGNGSHLSLPHQCMTCVQPASAY